MIPRDRPIAVIAPAGIYQEERFRAGLSLLREAGWQPEPLPGLLAPQRYLAADDDTRTEHLIAALSEPRWGAVWAARGGYGITRILDRLPFDRLPPRPFVGFSDCTPLLDALHRRCDSPAVHGPVIHSLPQTDAASREHLWRLLSGPGEAEVSGQAWVPGEAMGPLVGGNLCLIASTCGTAFQLDARGAILVIEEVGEPAYRIDRMLTQLRAAGVFAGVQGIALGTFTSCRVPEGAPWSLRDVLLDRLGDLDVPVLAGLPIGHGSANRAFPIGAPARIARERLSFRWERPE